MMKLVTRLIILMMMASLFGCKYIPTPSFVQIRDKHFLTAKSIPPMRTPPGVSSEAFKSEYPVSDRPYSKNAMDVNINPPGL